MVRTSYAKTSSEHIRTQCEHIQHDPSTSEHDAHASELPQLLPVGLGNRSCEIAQDFHYYLDKRSVLDRLTEAQCTAIARLLQDYTEQDVADLLAKPPPFGLSISVSRSALNRFKKRWQKNEQLRRSLQFQTHCEQLLEEAATNDQAFLHASERLLKLRLFEATGDPQADLDAIAKLANIITRLPKQTLAEQKHKGSPPTEANAQPIPKTQTSQPD